MSPKRDNKKNKNSPIPSTSNDQLGENASEVMRSEHYDNAKRSAKGKK